MKTALITGGSKGIGRGIVHALLDKGYQVAFTTRSDKAALEDEKSLNAKYPNRVRVFACDVRDYERQQAVVKDVLSAWHSIDVVVANAGVGQFASIEDLTIEQWQETIDVNLTGAFFTLKSSIEALKKSKGYYISISSLAGTNFFANGSAYNASKFGLTGFTQAAMLDLRQYGIKTTTIMPGSVSTFFNGHTPTDDDHWKIQPEDIGLIVTNLLEMPHRTLPSKIEVRPTQTAAHQ